MSSFLTMNSSLQLPPQLFRPVSPEWTNKKIIMTIIIDQWIKTKTCTLAIWWLIIACGGWELNSNIMEAYFSRYVTRIIISIELFFFLYWYEFSFSVALIRDSAEFSTKVWIRNKNQVFFFTDLASQLALLVWKLFPLPQCGKQRVLILLNHWKLWGSNI